MIKDYNIIKKLDIGTSPVIKYLLEKNSKLFLLRLYDPRFMESRYEAFNNIEILLNNNISVPNIYEYGILEDNSKGYAIFDYVEGISLNNYLNSNNEEKCAIKVANELLKMHNINITDDINLYNSYINSFNKKINKIENMNIAINLDSIKEFVLKNSYLLKQLKPSIIHGDFNTSNIVINDDKVSFIDLDVCKKNCSYNDLATCAFNIDNNNFYTYMINEYLKNKFQSNFWIIYNLYGILNSLDYLLYCNRMDNKTINDGINAINKFIEYNDNFKKIEPIWFNKSLTRKKVNE